MRYVYLKNGDAVEQVRSIEAGGFNGSGPEAFIADFITHHAQDEVLVLCRTTRHQTWTRGMLRAESYLESQSRAARLLTRVLAALRIGARMYRWKPDRILCGCSNELLWVSVLVARLRNIPIVCARHTGVIERKGAWRLVSFLDRASIRACDAVVCHGPFLRAQTVSLGIPDNKVYEFDVDLRDFVAQGASSPPPQELEHFRGRFATLVMFLGRLQHDKGIMDLLAAFQALSQTGNAHVGLVYVGQGEDLPSLKVRIREQDMAKRVLLLGRVPHASLPRIIRCADIVVAPTRPPLVEGRCMVMLESFVVGVPVIAPNYAAFPYAIRDGVNGLLFEAGSSAGLYDCLSRAVADARLREQLRRGAADAAGQLIATSRSFASAVELAFQAGAS